MFQLSKFTPFLIIQASLALSSQPLILTVISLSLKDIHHLPSLSPAELCCTFPSVNLVLPKVQFLILIYNKTEEVHQGE